MNGVDRLTSERILVVATESRNGLPLAPSATPSGDADHVAHGEILVDI